MADVLLKKDSFAICIYLLELTHNTVTSLLIPAPVISHIHTPGKHACLPSDNIGLGCGSSLEQLLGGAFADTSSATNEHRNEPTEALALRIGLANGTDTNHFEVHAELE
jgi:hypothetical protein